MSDVEVFLERIPGETRGVIVRAGRPDVLLIARDDDEPRHCRGARCVGRIDQIDIGMGGAFVNLGVSGATGFLPSRNREMARLGQRVEVEVVSEPRRGKGPVLRLMGEGQGVPRLLAAGPDIEARLAVLAPGEPIQSGAAASQVAIEAEEEALAISVTLPEAGLDLAVQRTRAMVTVDVDHVGAGGRDAARARRDANLQGLRHAARLVRLKGWGGLVAIDLIGAGQDAEPLIKAARQAFGGDPEVVFGPLNRFGVMMLALPWRVTPIEERMIDPDGRRSLQTRALDVVRALGMHLAGDTHSPRLTARCVPEEAERASAWVARLGPRAHLISDPTARAGRCTIEES
ncbi:hypothetical protein BH10PSE2_BH10PSE2_16550 [soil metagenome]